MTMTLFHEIYNVYYKAMGRLLREARRGGLDEGSAAKFIDEVAFSESFLYILDAIKNEQWQVMTKDFKTPLRHLPERPISLLERRWLAAVRMDPRMQLFHDGTGNDDVDAQPLYRPEDFHVTDASNDGDPYEDETYKAVFRTLLEAVQRQQRVRICYTSGKGREGENTYLPCRLEYSEKDDKFRLLAKGRGGHVILNLARIKNCTALEPSKDQGKFTPKKKTAVLELVDLRNALERCMIHFADLEKVTTQLSEKQYRVELFYRKEDETEILIRVMSFGPFIKAVSPPEFVNLVKERLVNQKKILAD